MTTPLDIAIIGAGPYGLSLGAHLRTTGVSVRQFGPPMRLWRSSMPRGMYLKSQGFASDLSSPDREHTLETFCRATNRPYKSYGLPVALDTFVAYGLWFRDELVPDIDETTVTDVVREDGAFDLRLESGERFRVRNVVVAAGVEHFAHMPDALKDLPPSVCTHSAAHDDLGVFSGGRVVVLGAGQSALESAALLHEGGADVELVTRGRELRWNGEPLAVDRPLLQRLRQPEAGLGSGWATWFYSCRPGMYRHLPCDLRVQRARTALGPAGACWLRPRVQGKVQQLLGHTVQWAKEARGGVALGLEDASGTPVEVTADHLIAATGYRSDLQRLTFLSDGLRASLRTTAGTPWVNGSYESSVPGLYFIGPAVAPTFGPVMRFVYGSDHAARTVARRFGGVAGPQARVRAGNRE